MPNATLCPDCGWQTRVWVDAGPGPSDWRCKVCDLQAENELLRESRARLRVELDEAQLRSIEARNPGIDMDEVRRLRAEQ